MIILKVRLAELMELVKTKLYQKYVITNSKGESMLFVKILKALYGLLRSALLFYLKIVKYLYGYGFRVNLIEPFMENIMLYGHQMNVT